MGLDPGHLSVWNVDPGWSRSLRPSGGNLEAEPVQPELGLWNELSEDGRFSLTSNLFIPFLPILRADLFELLNWAYNFIVSHFLFFICLIIIKPVFFFFKLYLRIVLIFLTISVCLLLPSSSSSLCSSWSQSELMVLVLSGFSSSDVNSGFNPSLAASVGLFYCKPICLYFLF